MNRKATVDVNTLRQNVRETLEVPLFKDTNNMLHGKQLINAKMP